MGVSLTEFEQPAPFAGDETAALAALQERIGRLQLAQMVHGRRAIILFEGWRGAGKKGALKAIAGALDLCHASVHCIHSADGDAGRHWLAPYWSRLPNAGETAIYFRSWYSVAVRGRVESEFAAKAWARTCDEINEFEAQQTDHGTLIVKLFFHVSAAVQAQRLRERRQDPWLDLLAEEKAEDRETLLSAWTDMFKRTDTRWAKWTVIPAADEPTARIAALSAVASALEKAIPANPPKKVTADVVQFVAGAAGPTGG